MDGEPYARNSTCSSVHGRITSPPLTESEERNLLRLVRSLPPDKRALRTAEVFGGFRISETLSWRLGQVVDRHGQVLGRISVRPAYLKGRRGPTRSVPVGPESLRALEAWVRVLARRGGVVTCAQICLFSPAGNVVPTARFARSHAPPRKNTSSMFFSRLQVTTRMACRLIP